MIAPISILSIQGRTDRGDGITRELWCGNPEWVEERGRWIAFGSRLFCDVLYLGVSAIYRCPAASPGLQFLPHSPRTWQLRQPAMQTSPKRKPVRKAATAGKKAATAAGWQPAFSSDEEARTYFSDFSKAVAADMRLIEAARRRSEELVMRGFVD